MFYDQTHRFSPSSPYRKIGTICKFLLLVAFVLPSVHVSAGESTAEATEAPSLKPIGHKLIWYVPNRLLDVFDIVRARVRIGPGLAAGARATEVVEAYLGAYDSIYLGLPGPRMRPKPKSPVGFERRSGSALVFFDLTSEDEYSPGHSPTEIGVTVHSFIVGAEAGVDPVEVLDLVGGLLLFDTRGDDL